MSYLQMSYFEMETHINCDEAMFGVGVYDNEWRILVSHLKWLTSTKRSNHIYLPSNKQQINIAPVIRVRFVILQPFIYL